MMCVGVDNTHTQKMKSIQGRGAYSPLLGVSIMWVWVTEIQGKATEMWVTPMAEAVARTDGLISDLIFKDANHRADFSICKSNSPLPQTTFTELKVTYHTKYFLN